MSVNCISILGGTGFVGTNLISRLANTVPQVKVLTRRRKRFNSLKVLSNVDVVEVDIHDEAALEQALAGSDVVINLVGILNQSGSDGPHSFSGAHVDLTKKVINATIRAGVGRYLHMSSLGADPEGTSEYLQTKGQAEQLVLDASDQLQSTIFRPSVIFGQGDAFFNRFGALLQVMPVFPLACPDSRLAPVYIGDVCKVMSDSISDPDTIGQSINLCGPDVFTLRELVELTRDTLELKRVIIGLPDFAARLQARVMEWVPGKPFSRDNYLSLQTDSVCPDKESHQPTSVHAIIGRYLGGKGKLAKLQSYRRYASRDL